MKKYKKYPVLTKPPKKGYLQKMLQKNMKLLNKNVKGHKRNG